MADFLGRIDVTAPTAAITFPLRTDFGHSQSSKRQVIVHQLGDTTGKVEQRFYVGPSARRFGFVRSRLRNSERAALVAFWRARQGGVEPFFYDVPQPDQTFVTTAVVFENAPFTLDEFVSACTVGLTFVEVPDPATAPTYAVSATVTRFPDVTLATSLIDQAQELVPLVRIRVLEAGVPDIFVSDRRITVAGDVYLPRLLRIGEQGSDVLISQSIGGESDNLQLTLGNADRGMIRLANDTDLIKARVELAILDVHSTRKLNLWAGEIVDWRSDAGAEFSIEASDIISSLMLQSPVRNISRRCWRIYGDASTGCPVDINDDTRDLVHFPSADMASCDLSYETGNGCLAHVQAIKSYGGVQVTPQQVKILDNSTGTAGFGRAVITPTSQIDDSAWGATIPEIWHDDDGVPQRGLPVNCRIVAGREESDFYEAVGIVGRGPIGAFTDAQMVDTDDDGIPETFVGSTLDGQPHHGFKKLDGGAYTDSNFGLREVAGSDPAGETDYLSLDRTGTTTTTWREVVSGGSVFLQNYAAGVAFLVIRRTDPAGVQPTTVASHSMVAMISKGLTALTWTGVGARGTDPGCTNPFWVAVNTFLRSKGADGLTAAEQEDLFDVGSAIACAAAADTIVPELFGAGPETQFRFKGSLDQLKPLRDRLRDILNNALGYFIFHFGKLTVGCRASALSNGTFSTGNMIFGSLHLEPIKPQFEKLTIEFGDTEYLFAKNTADYTDDDHAQRKGRTQNPLASQMGLVGSSTKSQSARIAVMRVREELGGVGVTEQTNARLASWKTTILALDTSAGQVNTVENAELPGGSAKFRIQKWSLNRDWSIDISATPVTDSMYDLAAGVPPAAVQITPQPVQAQKDGNVPPKPLFAARIAEADPTSAELYDLSVPTTLDTRTISAGTFTFYYYPSDVIAPTLTASITDTATSMAVSSAATISAGTYLQIDNEIVLAGTPSGLTIPITRAQMDTTAAAHTTASVFPLRSKLVAAAFPFDFFSSAALAAWTLRAYLPGMTVVEVAGFLTNLYGDGPAFYLATRLVLAKTALPVGTGALILANEYIQPLPGANGTLIDFFTDHVPADPPTGHPPMVPFRLYLNGDKLSPYVPDYYLAPGSNHVIMVVPPRATDAFHCMYRASGITAGGIAELPPHSGGGVVVVPPAPPTGSIVSIVVHVWASAKQNFGSATIGYSMNGGAGWHGNYFGGGSLSSMGFPSDPTDFTLARFDGAIPSLYLGELADIADFQLKAYMAGTLFHVGVSDHFEIYDISATVTYDSGVLEIRPSAHTTELHTGAIHDGELAYDTDFATPATFAQVERTGYTGLSEPSYLYFTDWGSGSVTFSLASGTVLPNALQTLTLAGPAGYIIYYTLDGSTPTTASNRYTSPIPIPAGLTVKAISVSPGGVVGFVSTGTYTISPRTVSATAGSFRIFWLVGPTSDSYLRNAGSTQKTFVLDHVYRLCAYPDAVGFDVLSWNSGTGFYRDSSALYNSDWSAGATGTALVASNPSWIYYDAAGLPCFIDYQPVNGVYPQYLPNYAVAGFQTWWIAAATSMLGAGRFLFIDDVTFDLKAVVYGGQLVRPVDPDISGPLTDAKFALGLVEFLEAVRAAFPGTEIIHNALYWNGGGNPAASSLLTRQIQACDWFNIEGGFADPAIQAGYGTFGLRTMFSFIDQVHGLGRHIIAQNSQGSLFSLACFALITDGSDMYQIADGGDPTQWAAINFVDLGAASGARYDWNGLIRRDFANGIVLVAEPGTSGSGALTGNYTDPNGNILASVALGSREGTILTNPCYYVSAAAGSDSWSGLLPAPNAGATDGPFLTLTAARSAMRAGSLKKCSVRAGTYSVSGGLTFTSADTGETWTAFQGEAAILDGGGSGTIDMTAADDFSFTGFRFQNLGAGGVVIEYGDGLTFQRNTFLDSLNSAIRGNFVTNSLITNNTFDGQTPGNAGGSGSAHSTVNLFGTSSGNLVSHNWFKNTDGGCVSFSNGPTQAGCSDNIIDRNLCTNVCIDVVDFGPLYIYDPSHTGTGNQITNNIVDGFGGPSGIANAVKGLYLDDETSNVLVSGNIVRGNGAWAFMIHGGDHNIFENNIADLSSGMQLSFYQVSPIFDYGMASNVYRKNLVYSSGAFPGSLHDVSIFGGDALPATSNNLYFSATGASIPNTDIVDSARVLADPQFTNAAAGDYSMPSGSPAFTTVGFVALATDQGPQ